MSLLNNQQSIDNNTLYLGDCYSILKEFSDDSVDLIYLDPPFFSGKDYKADNGEFGDKWDSLESYIAWLCVRVGQMHRILKSTGSIFLHCDYHANAYIRAYILDKIFGKENFRNEVIWYYKTALKITDNSLAREHDTIFIYAKSDLFKMHPDRTDYPVSKSTVERFGRYADEKGFVSNKYLKKDSFKDLENGGFYINQGIPKDVWDNIPPLTGNRREKQNYPTQKPEKLLKRIIEMASKENDVVLDPFMGSGTTLAVAKKLDRKYVGIDQSEDAFNLTKKRLDGIQGNTLFEDEE